MDRDCDVVEELTRSEFTQTYRVSPMFTASDVGTLTRLKMMCTLVGCHGWAVLAPCTFVPACYQHPPLLHVALSAF